MSRLSRFHPVQAALIIGMLASITFADGGAVYVRVSGSDLNDGRTSETAVRSIQRGVALATGSGHTIVVGPGIYYETLSIGTGAGSAAGSGTLDEPNILLADLSGARTGDAAAPVIIEGDSVRERGIHLKDREHWHFSGLTLRGQTRHAFHIDNADGVAIDSCTIYAPGQPGIEVHESDHFALRGSTFIRNLESGSCIRINAISRGAGRSDDRRNGKSEEDGDDAEGEHHHGRALGRDRRSPSAEGPTIEIAANRFSFTGPLYLAGGFRDSRGSSRRRGGGDIHAVEMQIAGRAARILVLNNVVSDCTSAFRLTIEGDESSAIVANNSIAGCWIGIEGTVRKGSLLAADNIVTHSKFALAFDGRTDGISIAGLLTFMVNSPVRGSGHASVSGLLRDVDPQFVAAASGDFALMARSPAIDAGLGLAGLLTDIRDRPRPIDGDGDGDARPDIGAYEFDPAADAQHPLRLVRWREIER